MDRSSVRLFAPQFSAELGAYVAAFLGTVLSKHEEREYEGGEHKMRPVESVRGCDVFVIAALNGDQELSANDKLCRLLFFIGALRDAGAATVTACVPYLCYARKDRRTQEHDPVATRYVAALFEAVGTDRVVVLDVHNEAAFDNAFRCETIRLEGFDVFAGVLPEVISINECVVASPDIGGVKRAQLLREELARRFRTDVGFAFMEKRRLAGVVSGDMFVGEVAGRDVVLYDDMIVSGATIIRATRAARQAGAKRVVVAASHAAFTPDAARLFADDGLDAVLVSDSIRLGEAYASHIDGKLRICSCAPLIASKIKELAAAPAVKSNDSR